MPPLTANQLVEEILEAIHESGCSGVLVSGTRYPKKFQIDGPFGSISLWVYIWTLTHGGRRSLRNEYRIQLTSVSSPLEVNPDGYTILIGFDSTLSLFAGFDLNRHRTFTTGSPSIQINISALRGALQNGMAFHRKTNSEIALGVRKDRFIDYALNSSNLHRYARFRDVFPLLQRATEREEITEDEILGLSLERRRIVRNVSRWVRSGNFRQQVLNAYGNRCAITRMQLKLVDAAHIIPVGASGSVDHVTNGIALSPTYHRAYDRGIIYLSEDYKMKIVRSKESELRKIGLIDGMPDFKAQLGRIFLPADRRQRPLPRFIRKANRIRRIC